MTSQDDFTNIQRRLLNIYERGHLMDQEQLNRAVDGLTGQTLQMVRTRRQETVTPRRQEAAPPVVRQDRPAPYTSPPRRQVLPLYYTPPIQPTAPLRTDAVVRRNPLEKIVTIKKAEFDANCTESCAICLETHKKGDSIITDCNHEFGKQCYNNWMTALNSNHQCPNCRKATPRVTLYKTRAARKQRLIIVD